MSTMTPELLPCPFCGAGADRIGGGHIRDGHSFGCVECGASVHAYNPNAVSKCHALWNTRPKTPASPEPDAEVSENAKLREALQNAVDALHLFLLATGSPDDMQQCNAILNGKLAHDDARTALATYEATRS
jgi:hypothetical protein